MRLLTARFLIIIVTLISPFTVVSDANTIEEDEILYHMAQQDGRVNMLRRRYATDEATMSDIETRDRQLAWYPGDPRAAWFISFPESGVQTFLHLIHLSTQRSTATNYGHLIMRRDGTFYAAFEDSQEVYENGPVYYAPYLIKKMPYVATQTHGTGYCLFCHPKKYYYGNFFWKSANGTKLLNGKRVTLQYNAEQVKKMIHLIRDPYDTVVARFFSYVSLKQASKQRYSLNADGFRLWCKDQNDTFEAADLAWLPAKLRGFAKNVPCRQEFVKYALFHSNVWKMFRFHRIERLSVKYDDYFYDVAGTVEKVNDFLGLRTLPNVALPKNILKRPLWEYSNFYTLAERDLIERLLRNMVTPALWPEIREYTPRYVLGDKK